MGKKQPAKIVNFSGYTGGFDVSKSKNTSNVSSRRKKDEKKQSEKKINFFPILIIILLAGVIYGGLNAPIFNVKKITVDNNYIYSDKFIIEQSRLAMNKNIFLQNTKLAIESIKLVPYSKDVKVVRKFPNEIKIILTERKRTAYVEYVDVYAIIDETGIILEEVYKKNVEETLTIIKGVIPKDIIKGFEIGKKIEADSDLKVQRLLNLINMIEKNQLGITVEVIDIKDKDNILVTIEDGSKIINFGDLSNMNIKIKYLEKILQDNIGKKGTIIMNSNENDLKPIFKETIGGKI